MQSWVLQKKKKKFDAIVWVIKFLSLMFLIKEKFLKSFSKKKKKKVIKSTHVITNLQCYNQEE